MKLWLAATANVTETVPNPAITRDQLSGWRDGDGREGREGTTVRPDVQRWLDRRLSSADRWSRDDVLAAKQAQGCTVSVVLPALDEQDTVGAIVAAVQADLVGGRWPVVDELVVVDSGSSDATARRAEAAGAQVVHRNEILPRIPAVAGKGEVLWRALAATTGDLLVFVDADLRHFSSSYVLGLLGPLLADPAVELVKAVYDRPLSDGATLLPAGGGRVTELVARPLLNLYWPELAGVVQPLAGEYAARRSLLEQLWFPTGYGVELAILVDTLELRGLDAIAQVDLGVRHHRHQDDLRLGLMASEILQVAQARLERAGRISSRAPVNPTLTQFARGDDATSFLPTTTDVELVERPPMRDQASTARPAPAEPSTRRLGWARGRTHPRLARRHGAGRARLEPWAPVVRGDRHGRAGGQAWRRRAGLRPVGGGQCRVGVRRALRCRSTGPAVDGGRPVAGPAGGQRHGLRDGRPHARHRRRHLQQGLQLGGQLDLVVRAPHAVQHPGRARLLQPLHAGLGLLRRVQPVLRPGAGGRGGARRAGARAGLPPDADPGQLRELRPDLRIAHFSHTPWAPPEYFALLPEQVGVAVLEGILGADRAGFLSPRWAEAFVHCCADVLGADIQQAADAGPDATAAGTAGGAPVAPLGRHPSGPHHCGRRAPARGRRFRSAAAREPARRRHPARRPARGAGRPADDPAHRPHGALEEHRRAGWRPTASCCGRSHAGTAASCTSRSPTRAGTTSPSTASTRLPCSGWLPRSTTSSGTWAGSPCCWTSTTTTRGRWLPSSWPTCWWSTRCVTG